MERRHNKYLWHHYLELLEEASNQRYVLTKNIVLKNLIDDIELLTANTQWRWSKNKDLKIISYVLDELRKFYDQEENEHNRSVLLGAIELIYKIKAFEYRKKTEANREMIRKHLLLLKDKLSELELE